MNLNRKLPGLLMLVLGMITISLKILCVKVHVSSLKLRLHFNIRFAWECKAHSFAITLSRSDSPLIQRGEKVSKENNCECSASFDQIKLEKR